MTPAKFKFDTEFSDRGDRVSLAARGRTKRTLTQDEIDQMCAKARAEGMKAGEARALEAIAAGTRDTASAVRQALGRAREEIEGVREEAALLALAMARKLAPAAIEALPAADVERVLRSAIHQAIGEPRILLRASPRVAEALDGKIAEIGHEEGFEGRIVVAADPNLTGADCRIEWRGGGAERSQAAMEQALAELIARRFSRPNNTHTEE
ncbi:MAG TPA: FliH/SctL family protein [Rhizomicrobium sp.]|nr:FliH/SctL family protein [Rhizomicrobium sp.]